MAREEKKKRQRRNQKELAKSIAGKYNTRKTDDKRRFIVPEIEDNPFRFRGAYSITPYRTSRSMPAEPSLEEAKRLIQALSHPGVDINVFRYMAEPGFSVPGQSVIQALQSFNLSKPFVTFDIEWLGSIDSNLFAITEVAVARMRDNDIKVSTRLVKPSEEQANLIADLIKRLQQGEQLTADEWRSLRDVLKYSPRSYRGLPGAQFSSTGELISHAQWALELVEGEDLRFYVEDIKLGLEELRRRGQDPKETAKWLSNVLSAAHARGEAVVSWNALQADVPAIGRVVGVRDPIYTRLASIPHVDLLAATRLLTENRVKDLIEPLIGRPLTPEEMANIPGYLKQEVIAQLLGISQQAHRAGSDVATLAKITKRLVPILRQTADRVAVVGANALDAPGRNLFDPTPVKPGDILLSLRGGGNPFSVVTQSGQILEKPGYRDIRANYAYEVYSIRRYTENGRRFFGVALSQVDYPGRMLYFRFESIHDLYRFFQNFTPVDRTSRAWRESVVFSKANYARRRFSSFFEPRPGEYYGFTVAKKFYGAAAAMLQAGLDPRQTPAEQIRELTGLRTEAEIRDFRELFPRLASEIGQSDTGSFDQGMIHVLRRIDAEVSDDVAKTNVLAAFYRRLNEHAGYGPEGPMERVTVPVQRRRVVVLDLPGIGEREINLTRRATAVSQINRILSELASRTTATDEAARSNAMRAHLSPILQRMGLISEQERKRILRHRSVHYQAEELADILIGKADEFYRTAIDLVSLQPRSEQDRSLLLNRTLIDAMLDDAIREAGTRITQFATPGGNQPALPAWVREFIRELDNTIRAPFHPSIGQKIRSAEDVLRNLMLLLRDKGIYSTLYIDPESKRMLLGMTVAENAAQLFSEIHRRGIKNLTHPNVAWVELPAVTRGGLLTGGKLSRPVADIERGQVVIRSRFDYALTGFEPWEIAKIKEALEMGRAAEAERIFSRGVRDRLERAVWTRTPWDDPNDFRFTASENLASVLRLNTMELSEDLVRHIALSDEEFLNIAKRFNVDLATTRITDLPLDVSVALTEVVQRKAPGMLGFEPRITSIKSEHIAKYMIEMPDADVRELYPWGHVLDVGRSSPRQALSTVPLLEDAIRYAESIGVPVGTFTTTLKRHELETKFNIPTSTVMLRTAIVGQQDLLDIIEAARRSGALSQERIDEILSSGFLTTLDEQIIISERAAKIFTQQRIHEIRLDKDAQVSRRLVESVDRYGNLIGQEQVIVQAQEVIARVRRGNKYEQIRLDIENATRIMFQGMRRDEETGELILRFLIQEPLLQGSRFRLGTHKAVVSIVKGLEELIPGIDALYFPSIKRRGQAGELAAGHLAKLVPYFSGTPQLRQQFLTMLQEETGIRAQWVQAGDQWRLALPTDEDLPLRAIEEFVERHGARFGIGLTEQIHGGPRVVTILAEAARLEQDESALQQFQSSWPLRPDEGILIGARERQVLRQNNLEPIIQYAERYSQLMREFWELKGVTVMPVDPKAVYKAYYASIEQPDLPVRRISEFGAEMVPVRTQGRGYSPADLEGTVFDINVTGRGAFILDLELPGYEKAVGRPARLAVVPEALLYQNGEIFFRRLNQQLRAILETAQDIRRYNALSEKELEAVGRRKDLDRLYNRLTDLMAEYRQLLGAELGDYEGSVFKYGGMQSRVPGATMRLHVLDPVIDQIPEGVAFVSPEFFERFGLDPSKPHYVLVNRYPTDPSSLQVNMLLPSAKVTEVHQIGLPKKYAGAQGGDTDSDLVAMSMVESNVKQAIKEEINLVAEMPDGPEKERMLRELQRLHREAEKLDIYFEETVQPTMARLFEERVNKGMPLGVEDVEHLQAVSDMGSYAQAGLDPSERYKAFTSANQDLVNAEGVIRATPAKEAFEKTLTQRQSARLIGTVTQEIQRIINLAHYVWGKEAGEGAQWEKLHKLKDLLDIVKEQSISAQKWGEISMPAHLVDRYGKYFALGVRRAFREARFDELEEILKAIGTHAKTKRDLAEDFVKERVALIRELYEQAGPFWNDPKLRIGLKGFRPDQREVFDPNVGPITEEVRYVLSRAGISEDVIQQADRAAREQMRRSAELAARRNVMRAMADETAEVIASSAARSMVPQSIGAGFTGAAIGMGLMVAAWLLPHALGGPRAELERPDVVHAPVPDKLRQMMIPEAEFPNVTPAPAMPVQAGLHVLIRARSPGGLDGEEVSSLVEQAVYSAVQVPLNINASIRDDRSAIDRAWIQRQIAAALR